ncbi:PAS domain S-box protein [Kiloniella antarctica]|uniref:histidine kinase n=1 Tax=Kiloniella antarctica TaxID=1550907 RepID=A0ABW5BKY3_9PROT
MQDVTADALRAVVLFVLVIVVFQRRPAKELLLQGWGYLTTGVVLFAFGAFLDLVKRYEPLSNSLSYGEHQTLPLLALSVGYVGGCIALILGVVKIVPCLNRLSDKIEKLETAEAAVERHNIFLQTLIDAMPAQVYFKDHEGKFISCNKLFLENIGMELNEIVGKTSHEIFPQKLADVFIEADKKAIAEGQTEEQEAIFIRKDGSDLHILMHKARFDNPDRTYGGLIGISVDISARKKAEHALRVSEERLRRLSELSNEAIIIHSKEGVSDCNDAALKLFGYGYEEMISLGTKDLIAPEAMVMVQDYISNAREGIYESIGIHKNGSFFEISINAKNSVLDGEATRVTFIRDISTQKKVEGNLRKLSKAVEQNPVAIEITDPNGVIEYVNPKFLEVTGYTAEEVIGKNPNMLKSGHTTPEEYQKLWETISSGKVWSGAFKNRRKNGEFFWEWASISSVVDEQGVITNYVAAKEDITKQRLAEIQLMEAKESAELANRAKSEFLANMSHELRTPLNAIIGFSELMEREIFGPLGSRKYQEYLGDIKNSGDHLLQLINDILDLSKIEAGEFSLNEESLNLKKLIESSITIMRTRLEHGDLDLEVDTPSDLPNVYADERGVKQILINLLSNAVKFTPAGGKIRIVSQSNDDGVSIKIIDTGIGIPADKIEDVMNPFIQVDGTMARQSQGTGLGLSISQKLCHLHEGSLGLVSIEGKGTTASVLLPESRIIK